MSSEGLPTQKGVSHNARLGGMPGRGYLVLETEGYRRAEGVFFTDLAHRDECKRYFVEGRPAAFVGVLLRPPSSEDPFSGRVYVRGIGEESGRLKLRIQALGSY